MVTLRRAVGARYGLKDWMAQRITAVIMALYTLLLLAIVLWNGGMTQPVWKALFASGAFRLATFVFAVSLFYHAWIGVRDIYMDYIKCAGLRLALHAATIALLVAYVGWTIQLLWGAKS